MTEAEHAQVVANLPRALARLYPAMVKLYAEKGPIGAPDLAHGVAGTDWRGRGGGLSKELDGLRKRGLIRKIAERESRAAGRVTLLFKVSDPDEVEQAMREFDEQGPGIGWSRQRKILATDDPVRELRRRLRDYEMRESASYTSYWKTRRQITEISLAFLDFSEKIFWEDSVHENDIARAEEDMATLAIILDRAMEAVEQRRAEDKVRQTLSHTENTNGRVGGDLIAVKEGRKRLRKRLDELKRQRVTSSI